MVDLAGVEQCCGVVQSATEHSLIVRAHDGNLMPAAPQHLQLIRATR